MNRKTWDYEKYGGYLDPEENIFFGPITKRELLKSVEVAEERIKRRRDVQSNKTTFETIQETCEDSKVDRTFKIIDEENIDPSSEKEDLNRTYELDESQNPCLCPQIITEKNDCNKNDISALDSNKTIVEHDDLDNRPHLISILSDPLKDVSNLNENLAKTKISVDTQNSSAILVKVSPNTPVLKKGCLLDDTCSTTVTGHLPTPLIEKSCKFNLARDNNNDTSTLKKGSLLDDTCSTIVNSRLPTPLLEKSRKFGFARVSSKGDSSLDKTLTNKSPVCGTAERCIKLSDTFITEMTQENCLINSSPNDSTNQRTPDVFRQKRNEIWHRNSPAKKFVGAPVQSKLPLLKKTPNTKFLPVKSPVADYIYRGISVQSASKDRHSYCLNEMRQKSKSDQKDGKFCKIPISTNTVAKRKLQMGETKHRGPKSLK